jgi:hypothetical protein
VIDDMRQLATATMKLKLMTRQAPISTAMS